MTRSLWPGPSATGARFCRAAHTLSRPGPDPDGGVGWAGGGGRSNFTMPTSAVAPAGGPGEPGRGGDAGQWPIRTSGALNAELHEPGRACCGTGSYRHLDSADVPWVGGRLGERTVQPAGHCRFVASQVACGSDRNGDGTARAEMQVVFALETLHLSVLCCPSGVAAANFSLVLLAPVT